MNRKNSQHYIKWLLYEENNKIFKNRYNDIHPKKYIYYALSGMLNDFNDYVTIKLACSFFIKSLILLIVGVYGLYRVFYILPIHEIGDIAVHLVVGVICTVLIFGSLGGFARSYLYFYSYINLINGYYILIRMFGIFIEGIIVDIVNLENGEKLLVYSFSYPSKPLYFGALKGKYLLHHNADLELGRKIIVLYLNENIHLLL